MPERRTWLAAALVLLDVILINMAFALAYWIRYEAQWVIPVDEVNYNPFDAYTGIVVLLSLLLPIAFKVEGLYDQRREASWLDEVYSIFSGTLIGIAVLVFLFFYVRPLVYSRLMLFYLFVLIVILVSLSRLVLRLIFGRLRRRGIGVERVLIVGAGDIGRTVMRNMIAQPELGYQIVGFVDDDPDKRVNIGRVHALGSTHDLPAVLHQQPVDQVIITLPWDSHRQIMQIIADCEGAGVRTRIVPDLFQLSLSRVQIDTLNGVPLIGVKAMSIRGWNLALKRLIDVVISGVLLILNAPLLFAVALLIKWDSPGPVLFRQKRVGRAGQMFTVFKFRSMRFGAENERYQLTGQNEASGPLFKIRHDPRITRVGRWLRRLSLDELPQLYNVFRGEMSLVGPRPAIPAEVEQYQEWHRRRLDVSPGMTGLWQVSGRSELTFDEMVMLDLFYAENWSLGMDFKILVRTIPTMLLGTGAY
ncbi:MAG: undecaprenyl-phosphate glucose phosphotransferase [Chloroflexi bacterium RBG_16_57_9]|nr:MAG: undecaprenyl-phosphate glucose phosphotransferase [Chloroflexi bacterium RBG_16_57_9]